MKSVVWEYMRIDRIIGAVYSEGPEHVFLNRRGLDAWELVAVTQDKCTIAYYFKRLRP